MEEKLVKVLLDHYKEEGLDMYALLDDSNFQKLDLSTKVDLIKKYASHISSGTSKTLTKKDISSLVLDALFSGTVTGITAGIAAKSANAYFKNAKLPFGALAGAVALGAAMSAGTSYLNSQKMIKNRKDILSKINETAKNPTDENALKVITTRHYQLNPAVASSIKSKTVSHMSGITGNVPNIIMGQVSPVVYHAAMDKNWKTETARAEGVSIDDLAEAVYGSKTNLDKSFKSSLDTMYENILGKKS